MKVIAISYQTAILFGSRIKHIVFSNQQHDDQPHKVAPPQDGLLPCPVLTNPPKLKDDGSVKTLHDPLSQGGWQRSSTLTPEAWQQQVDKQLQQQEMEKQAEEWANQRGPRANQQFSDPVFKESRSECRLCCMLQFQIQKSNLTDNMHNQIGHDVQ